MFSGRLRRGAAPEAQEPAFVAVRVGARDGVVADVGVQIERLRVEEVGIWDGFGLLGPVGGMEPREFGVVIARPEVIEAVKIIVQFVRVEERDRIGGEISCATRVVAEGQRSASCVDRSIAQRPDLVGTLPIGDREYALIECVGGPVAASAEDFRAALLAAPWS